MARNSLVYTFDITLEDVRRSSLERFVLRVARHPSESASFLVTRVLAYCLEFEDGLEMDGTVCQGDRPAMRLVRFGPRMEKWVDVGGPAPDRLRRAARQAERVVVYAVQDAAPLARALALERARWRDRVTIRRIDPQLVERLSPLLERRMAVDVAVRGDELFVRADGITLTGMVMTAWPGSTRDVPLSR